MSGTLPFTMISSLLWSPVNTEFCFPRPTAPVVFPFNETFSHVFRENPRGNFPGWMPDLDTCVANNTAFDYESHPAPGEELPLDQSRLSEGHNSTSIQASYDPKCDPLRVSNLDQNLLDPIEGALKSRLPLIKHVMLITMESTRKDMFPVKKDSHVYRKIQALHKTPEQVDGLDHKLAGLSHVSQLLTGESSGFDDPIPKQARVPTTGWRSRLNESFGGINVRNAMTGSAFTLKSLIGSHCGVEPMPVDFTEEVHGHMYQPCIPHILDLLNKQEETSKASDADFRSFPWESTLVQSITDTYDSQDLLDIQMGLGNVIEKGTLLDPSSKYYPPKQEECNYFGFPESETLPYMRDIILEAEKNKKRLFLSHVTSTTHHPYNTPKSWNGTEDYLPRRRWGGNDPFNQYLNTIKYQDEWIGTIFDLLEETNVINETLVVLVGDQYVCLYL